MTIDQHTLKKGYVYMDMAACMTKLKKRQLWLHLGTEIRRTRDRFVKLVRGFR